MSGRLHVSTEFRTASNRRFRSIPSVESILAILIVLVAAWLASTYEFRTAPYSDLTGRLFDQHLRVLQGEAGNPTQFRPLPEWIWDLLIRVQTVRGSGDPIYTSLLVLRYTQNLLLFTLAYCYYRVLGLHIFAALLGIAMLSIIGAASVSLNWLRLSSNLDVSFYLLAGILILRRHDIWIIPLAMLASLNREGSGFIPFMLLTARIPELMRASTRTRTLTIVGLAIVGWFSVYVAMRVLYPPQALVTDLFDAAIQLNLGRETSWMNIFGTFGVLPLVALLGMRTWPHLLRIWFWLIVPLWIVVHVLASLINETVLFFEPTALLLIPGSIFAAMHVASPERVQRTQREPVPVDQDQPLDPVLVEAPRR